jgi:hypothetical protein
VDEKVQKRSTVRLGIRLIHKICPEAQLPNAEMNQQQKHSVQSRSLRSRLSPKARKLIKQTSLIIHGSSNNNNNSNTNGSVKSIVETDALEGFNRVSKDNFYFFSFPFLYLFTVSQDFLRVYVHTKVSF